MKSFALASAVALALFSSTAVSAHGAPPCSNCGSGGGIGTPTNPNNGDPDYTPGAGATIDFTGETAYNFSSFAENGYTLTAASGTFLGTNAGAGGSRAIDALGPLAADYDPNAAANVLSLTRNDGGFFTINSLMSDRGIDSGTNTITVQGYIDGKLAGTATITSSYDGLVFAQATNLTKAFDLVKLTLSTTSSSGTIDNIQLSAAAAAPEPGSWAMMLGGFGLIGGAMRRRARMGVRFA